jgi:hypothetical protein
MDGRYAWLVMSALGQKQTLPQELAPTPSCHDGAEPTVSETEGPFFKPRSPERSELREAGARGRQFELSGVVVRAVSARDSSHAAASMPIFSRNRRRSGFDSLFMSMTTVIRPAPHLS